MSDSANGQNDIERVKQHALKLTEALYRTTELFYDGEPLKWSLRQIALDILGVVSEMQFPVTQMQLKNTERMAGLIGSLFTRLELAASGTFVSKANFDVLEREYIVLRDQIGKYKKSQPLLDIPRLKLVSDTLSDIVSDTTSPQLRQGYAGRARLRSASSNLSDKWVGKEERKEMILTVLRESGPSGIGELTKKFSGSIGEKTVQRELNSMASAGLIKREGEKRWRRYFV